MKSSYLHSERSSHSPEPQLHAPDEVVMQYAALGCVQQKQHAKQHTSTICLKVQAPL